MSKIDEYKKIKNIAQQVKTNYLGAHGLDSDNNDKHHVLASFWKCMDDWNDAAIVIHASYGYYGSSSGYSAMDEKTAEYITKALNNNLSKIFKEAVELAEKDVEKARLAAKEEAEQVLGEVKK